MPLGVKNHPNLILFNWRARCHNKSSGREVKIMEFNLERLVNDVNNGTVKGAEIRIDPAHNGKQDHIDAHVFYHDRNAIKLTNMTGVEALKEACPWMTPGSTLNL